jgi:hypothetical protein
MLSMLHASTDNNKLFDRPLHEEPLDVDLDEEEIDIIDKPSSKFEPGQTNSSQTNIVSGNSIELWLNGFLQENSTTQYPLVVSKGNNASPKEKRTRDTDEEDTSTKRFKATAEAVEASEVCINPIISKITNLIVGC